MHRGRGPGSLTGIDRGCDSTRPCGAPRPARGAAEILFPHATLRPRLTRQPTYTLATVID